MSLASRRGTSLAEVLVALTMLGIVAAVVLRLLAGNMRLYHSHTQLIDRAQNLRSAAAMLTTELQELSATDGDIYSATPISLSFRAMRRIGFVCAAPSVGATHLAIREQLQFGSRDFDPTSDSLLIYATGDSLEEGDWLVARLTGLRAGTCADGAPAVILETSATLGGGDGARIPLGAPVRGFEPVTYRLYRAGDGEWQIGFAARGDVIQPLVGPVTTSGLDLQYRNAAGDPVSALTAIAAIEIRLRMPTAQPIRGPNGALIRVVDSVVTAVALRNDRLP